MRSWRRTAYRAVRPLLFSTDPEAIHQLTLSSLALAGRSSVGRALCRLATGVGPSGDAPVELMGLHFRNRVGVGAGFDKDGVALRGWAALGLGFAEVGTVTPQAQPGNARPRLFRLARDEALVNRMGFNNAGADALARRIAAARGHLPEGFVVGVNVGRNRDTPAERSIDDYVAAAAAVAAVAGYLVVNVSSPNTPGLRELERPERIGALLEAVERAAEGRPMLAKLSPDLDPADRDLVLDRLLDSPARGVILSNTTTQRPAVRSAPAREPGGLSGRPLLPRTLAAVAQARARVGDRLVIVASGGIGSGNEARAALGAGADLVQLWTGLVYAGTALIGESVHATGERPEDGPGR